MIRASCFVLLLVLIERLSVSVIAQETFTSLPRFCGEQPRLCGETADTKEISIGETRIIETESATAQDLYVSVVTTRQWHETNGLQLQNKANEIKDQRAQQGVNFATAKVAWLVESLNREYIPGKMRIADLQKLPDQAALWRSLNLDSANPTADSMLFYVHGVNNTFDSSAFQIAHVGHRTGYKGPLVLFSWPSQSWPLGKAYKYLHDRAEMDYAKSYIRATLVGMVNKLKANQSIDVLAHSLGSEGVSYSLAESVLALQSAERLRHVVFAAPDIDSNLFERDLSHKFKASQSVSIYVSPSDAALKAAEKVFNKKRLGQVAKKYSSNIDTIRVYGEYPTIERHNYFVRSAQVLLDLEEFLVQHRRAEFRSSLRPERDYWKLEMSAPEKPQKSVPTTTLSKYYESLRISIEETGKDVISALRRSLGLNDPEELPNE